METRVPCEIRIGEGRNARTIANESRYLLGPVEGSWWVRYSWWVIPMGLLLIFLPWLFLFQGGTTTSPTTSQPVVIQQAPPATQVSPAPAQSGELTAEELDRRHTEYVHRRD